MARHCRDTGKKLRVLWLDAHADFNIEHNHLQNTDGLCFGNTVIHYHPLCSDIELNNGFDGPNTFLYSFE